MLLKSDIKIVLSFFVIFLKQSKSPNIFGTFLLCVLDLLGEFGWKYLRKLAGFGQFRRIRQIRTFLTQCFRPIGRIGWTGTHFWKLNPCPKKCPTTDSIVSNRGEYTIVFQDAFLGLFHAGANTESV